MLVVSIKVPLASVWPVFDSHTAQHTFEALATNATTN